MTKKFVFGPVLSRRLGFSLGVDIIPRKYCTFDCIYCQVGRTTNKEIKRASFFDREDIVCEIEDALKSRVRIDHITFSGSGEPTLNEDLGWLIRETKKITTVPVAVITNSSLLSDEKVSEELMTADVILPSLDAASEDIFRYINRPHMDVELKEIIRGLKMFTQAYRGKVWLEIMLIKDINDEFEELERFRRVIDTLRVDKVQLNTVTRPPAEESVEGIKTEQLEKIKDFFGKKCEVISRTAKSVSYELSERWEEKIVEILKRRPLTIEDVSQMTGIPIKKAKSQLAVMEKRGRIRSFCMENTVYYSLREAP